VLRWTGQTPDQTMMPEVYLMTWWCMVLVLVCPCAQARAMWLHPPGSSGAMGPGVAELLLPGSIG
jgi:hypothetical protein